MKKYTYHYSYIFQIVVNNNTGYGSGMFEADDIQVANYEKLRDELIEAALNHKTLTSYRKDEIKLNILSITRVGEVQK